jgi:hypothetical protein
MTEVEKAKLAAVLLVFVLIFGTIVYAGSYVAAGNSAQTVSGCESRVFLSTEYTCIAALANSTRNLSMCSILPGQQYSSCIYAVASTQMNASACKLINSTYQGMYSQCIISLAKYSKNYPYCATLGRDAAMQCIANILNATSFSSANGCYSMANATLGAACASYYYYHNAVSTLAPAYCSYLSSKPNTTILYYVMYASALGLGGFRAPGVAQNTEFLGYNESVANYCYYSIAELENNPALCKFASQGGAQLCTYLIANTSASTSNSA